MPDVNANMMVIRKRLESTSDPDFRTLDGVVQRTGDGGVTWVDSPANDVRHADAWRLPPIVAEDPKCQAAANMTRFLVNWFELVLPIMAAAGSGWALLSTLILLFVTLGPFALVVIMLDVAATLLGIGAGAIGAAFTTEVFDLLTCCFYDNIGDDGQVSAAQLVAINDQVDADIGGVAATVLHLIFALVGEVQVSNWGVTGSAPADCDDCEHCPAPGCFIWDFSTEHSELDWSIEFGVWTPGFEGGIFQQSCIGGVGSNSQLIIYQEFPTVPTELHTVINSVEFDAQVVGVATDWLISALDEFGAWIPVLSGTAGAGGSTFIGGAITPIDAYGLKVECTTDSGCGSGDVYLHSVRIDSDDLCGLDLQPNC